MTWAALIFLPLILVYQGWTYWIFRKRVTPRAHPGGGAGPTVRSDLRPCARSTPVSSATPRRRAALSPSARSLAVAADVRGRRVRRGCHAADRPGDRGKPIASLSGLLARLAVVVVVRGVLLWLSDRLRPGRRARGRASCGRGCVGGGRTPAGRAGWPGATERGGGHADRRARHGRARRRTSRSYLPQLIAHRGRDAAPGAGDRLAGPHQRRSSWWSRLPLIPVFMMLVGWATQAAQKRQWRALHGCRADSSTWSAGLSTLKLFGAAAPAGRRASAVSEEYRVHTMRVLRMSFLSGFVLELAGEPLGRVIAVAIGLRLLDGSLELSVGLFVLLLAPGGVPAAAQGRRGLPRGRGGDRGGRNAFEIVEEASRAADDTEPRALPRAHGDGAGRAVGEPLVFDRVTVRYGAQRAVEDFSAAVAPGDVTVLSAPSGSGKSTLLAAALGFVPFDGSITLAGRGDAEGRRAGIAWAGQTPGLIAGTVASNVALGASEPDAVLVEEALRHAVAGEVSPSTRLGVGGSGLSEVRRNAWPSPALSTACAPPDAVC